MGKEGKTLKMLESEQTNAVLARVRHCCCCVCFLCCVVCNSNHDFLLSCKDRSKMEAVSTSGTLPGHQLIVLPGRPDNLTI